MTAFTDLEEKVRSGQPFAREDGERILASTDLIDIGSLGDLARKALHGNRVTFGRVCELAAGQPLTGRGDAGEVRLTGAPLSADEAVARVRQAAREAAGVPLTGFSAADLLQLAGGDHLALAGLALALKREGLEAVAEVPIDGLGDIENIVEVVRAIARGGLGAWRATLARAAVGDRLDAIDRAAAVQRQTGAFKAFAPLPRHTPGDLPSTGYDDVRTIAVARLICSQIPSIQVDWTLDGPKLAQVAIAYGADDIDGIAAVDPPGIGHRRSAVEDIGRQIRMAFAEPAERNGRYEIRS
jgi:aminodeoxyfutalosine synthase